MAVPIDSEVREKFLIKDLKAVPLFSQRFCFGQRRHEGHPMALRDISRREFLRHSSLAVAATVTPVWLPQFARPTNRSAKHCIMLLLAGAPSQLDTWDPKPDAISDVRGPLRPISTNVDGIQVSEIFPLLAKQADKYALVRSVHSHTSPLHAFGCQEIQTGRVFTEEFELPHCGSVVAKLKAADNDGPGHVLLSKSVHDEGKDVSVGHSARTMGDVHGCTAILGASACAVTLGSQHFDVPSTIGFSQAFDLGREPQWIRERYGDHDFGRACLAARRMVEWGVTFVTINVFDPVVGQRAWDIHGSPPFPSIAAYREEIGPKFDGAYSALLEDLQSRGLLHSVLVLAVGEFGRTPRINSHGGRDHWTGCWTAVFAGGGVRGGQVVGASDAIASEPRDRPVTPAQIVATVYHSLGVPLDAHILGPQGEPMSVVEPGTEPILELF